MKNYYLFKDTSLFIWSISNSIVFKSSSIKENRFLPFDLNFEKIEENSSFSKYFSAAFMLPIGKLIFFVCFMDSVLSFVCFMQIQTNSKDYLFLTVKLGLYEKDDCF